MEHFRRRFTTRTCSIIGIRTTSTTRSCSSRLAEPANTTIRTRVRAYRSQSPPVLAPPALVLLEEEDLISIGRFRTRGPTGPEPEPFTTTSSSTINSHTVIRTTTADGSDNRRPQVVPKGHQQLSSDYCRYVAARTAQRAAGMTTGTMPPSGGPSPSSCPVDFLSESTLEQMRQQVRHQRLKVEEESRRHHHYHSQRSTRNTPPVDIAAMHQQQQMAAVQKLKSNIRPVSSYYDGSPTYETIQHNGPIGGGGGGGSQRKTSLPSSPVKQQQQQQSNWNGSVSSNGTDSRTTTSNGYPVVVNHGSIRSRGPFVTQVQIQNQMSYQ